MARTKQTLADPFPIEKLRTLNFGSVDGHRDKVVKHAFVITSSIRQFFLDQHSIVVGAIGSGKSTLFQLLKLEATKLEAYQNHLIVPIEETLSFIELSQFAKDYFDNREPTTLYQLIWKFNILSKTATALSQDKNFPSTPSERKVNQFLMDTNSGDACVTIIGKLRDLIENANIRLEANIADNPITFSAGLKDRNNIKSINLDEIQQLISNSIVERKYTKATVIIDKIDRFVAGIEYLAQKDFILGLLEVDDDLASDPFINLKIFLRADLFERLNFGTLGYDKVNDNVVHLRWSNDETLRFLATRLVHGLKNAKIAELDDLLLATDLSGFGLSFSERLMLNRFIQPFFNKKARKERLVSLHQKFDKAIITKMFPRNIPHYCLQSGLVEEVPIINFIATHFLDGNNVCTPRYILIFLKEVTEKTAEYYDENPDQVSEVIPIGKDFEWDLFKKSAVYKAYCSAKDIYVRNIGTVETKWTKHFEVFLAKRGNKTKFDYKWVRANISDFSENETIDFLAFLQVIGFLTISDPHADIKKRGYELPILYKVSPTS